MCIYLIITWTYSFTCYSRLSESFNSYSIKYSLHCSIFLLHCHNAHNINLPKIYCVQVHLANTPVWYKIFISFWQQTLYMYFVRLKEIIFLKLIIVFKLLSACCRSQCRLTIDFHIDFCMECSVLSVILLISFICAASFRLSTDVQHF